MEKQKPHYLGKVLPADDKDQITKFLDKKYDAFNTVYDACKDHSDSIVDISNISEKSSDDLRVKVSSNSSETLSKIGDSINESKDAEMKNDTITVKCAKDNDEKDTKPKHKKYKVPIPI